MVFNLPWFFAMLVPTLDLALLKLNIHRTTSEATMARLRLLLLSAMAMPSLWEVMPGQAGVHGAETVSGGLCRSHFDYPNVHPKKRFFMICWVPKLNIRLVFYILVTHAKTRKKSKHELHAKSIRLS